MIFWILQPILGYILSSLISPAPHTTLDLGENIPLKFTHWLQYERGMVPAVKELEIYLDDLFSDFSK